MDKKIPFRLTPICQVLTMMALLADSQAVLAAANFKIVPAGNLPTSVPAGGSVTANYTITNQTRNTRSNYLVTGLPATVTHDASSPNCSNPIYLLPKQSCNLALKVTGPVNSKFALCNVGSCTTSPDPLVVSVSSVVNLTPVIAVGTYNDNNLAFHPLLARYDGSISYPASIISNLPTNPTYVRPNILAAGCSSSVCIAVGNDDDNGTSPFVAFSSDQANTWTYPIGSTGTFPPFYAGGNAGRFSAASCSGNFCIASGFYVDTQTAFPHPFVAQYANNSWTYPINSTNPPPGYNIEGGFNAASCSGTICVAVGYYDDFSSNSFPVLAETIDGGTIWSYEIDNSMPPNDIMQKGSFLGVSCHGSMCIAGGTYEDATNAVMNPLLAQSTDGGLSWSYAIDSGHGPQLPLSIAVPDQFNSASCSANICIAAGTYYDSNTTVQSPLLAQSTDSGATWVYTITGVINVPANMVSDAFFTSSSCDGALCVAAGYYTNTLSQQIPMLAQTTDAGQTWTYAIDAAHGPSLPGYTGSGRFNSATCANNVCMAVGSYMVGQATYPMYAQSTNGGSSWTYVINSNPATLPSDYNNYAIFNGSASTATASLTLPVNGYSYEFFKKGIK